MRGFTSIIFVALLAASSASDNFTDILESPQITDFGDWGHFDNCTEGLLVTGFQLKVEHYRRRLDNTALNAIKLFCGNVIYKTMQEISSSRGPFGRYQKPKYCSSYAIGFQLMSQTYQGRNRDDVSAVNFKLICADGIQLEGYRELSGHDYRESRYTEARYCPIGQGICGIQTQVEYHRGLGDDTALNNVRVKCCDVHASVSPTLPTSQPLPSEEYESTTFEAVHETQPEQGIPDSTTEIEISTTESDSTSSLSNDITTEVVTEVVPIAVIDVTPEAVVVTGSTPAAVTEVVPIVVTDTTAEVITEGTHEAVVVTEAPEVVTEAVPEVTPETVTDAPTEVVTEDAITEVVTEVTTEVDHHVSPELVVTDATTIIDDYVNDVTTEVVNNVTTQPVVHEATPDVVTDATTEVEHHINPAATTTITDDYNDVTTEVINDLTTEVVVEATSPVPHEVTPDY